MEINTQNMEALLHLQEQQAQLPRKQTGAGSGFDSLLNQRLGAENPVAQLDPALVGNAGIYSTLMLEQPEHAENLDTDSAVLMEAFNQASGTLDLWDSYRRTLGNATNATALRDAWGLLEGIDSQVNQLRNASARNPELDAILNELEILSTTEKFKFNRGDYIS